jgi:uncharacterized protein YecE (DUF72 family)
MGVAEVRIGCSGWNYAHWRNGVFYPPRLPPRRWLAFYAEHFDTVEVNATFYRLPRPSAVEGWVEQTPPDFLSAVKMSRYVTHVRRLRGLEESLPLFYERIDPLVRSSKLGPILWQLGPNFRRDDERLASALALVPPGRHAWEFRHESWFVEPVYELLRAHAAALVIGHHPKRPFQALELTADWTFLRFHHGARGRNGNYSERELEEWARHIEGWRDDGADVYAYFNNDWNGYAIRNGLWLRRRLR